MKQDVIFCGVGGQGVVVSSDIFCEAALIDGFDVAKAEIHGMAQRGGSIVAHARVGQKVQAPLIERRKADVIMGFEVLETARALPMLRNDGTVVVNTSYLPPNIAAVSSSNSWNKEKLLEIIRERAHLVYEINAAKIAEELENLLVVNTILLGALSALPETPVKKESFEKAIAGRIKMKYVKLNLQAFQRGRESITMR